MANGYLEDGLNGYTNSCRCVGGRYLASIVTGGWYSQQSDLGKLAWPAIPGIQPLAAKKDFAVVDKHGPPKIESQQEQMPTPDSPSARGLQLRLARLGTNY